MASCYARDRRASPSCWDQLIRSFAGLFCAQRVRRVEHARETVPVCWSLEGWDSVFYLCMRWVWMCGCVSCSCAPQSAMLRVGSLGWMYRGGVGVGGCVLSCSAALCTCLRAVVVYRTHPHRRAAADFLSIRISVRRAPTRAPMPSHTAQPYMQRASSVRRERPRAIKHTNCSLETTPQQRHDPQI